MASRKQAAVKPHLQRFPPPRSSGSGIDPLGSFKEFTKNDVVRNIDIHRDTVKRTDDLQSRKDCPAVGTTTMTKGLPVPRSPTAEPVSLPTESVRSQSQERPRYAKSAQSGEAWVPQVHPSALSNRQSTTYNPITFQPLTYAIKATCPDARRKKGVTEFADKQNPYGDRLNPAYNETFRQDPTVFRRRTGIFSHMYDASARQGYISKPFEGKRDSQGKAPFK